MARMSVTVQSNSLPRALPLGYIRSRRTRHAPGVSEAQQLVIMATS